MTDYAPKPPALGVTVDVPIHFDTDDVFDWELRHVISREFGPSPWASTLAASIAAWLLFLEAENPGAIVHPVGTNWIFNEDGEHDVIVSVEVA